MRVIFVISTLLFFLFTSQFIKAQSSNQEFEITGIIRGLGNRKILLGNKPNGYGGGFKIVYYDSCIAHNDSFSFKGNVREPNFYSIEVAGSTHWNYFVIEPSKIQINGEVDSIWKAKVTGSKQNDIYSAYRENIRSPYIDTLDSYWDKIDRSRKNNDTASINRYQDSLRYYANRRQQAMLKFVKSNPSSFASLYNLYSNLSALNIDTAKKYFLLLDQKMQNHSLGKQTYHELFELPKLFRINQQMPNFSLEDSNNKFVNLIDYRGKYILLDFWASWCGPCLEEVPKIRELYKSYHQKGFDVIGITLDSDRNKWLNTVKKYKINWTTLCDLKGSDNKVALLFGINQIPTKLLIDPSGKLVLKDPSIEDLAKYLSANIN